MILVDFESGDDYVCGGLNESVCKVFVLVGFLLVLTRLD